MVREYYKTRFPLDLVYLFLEAVTGLSLEGHSRLYHEDFSFVTNGEWNRNNRMCRKEMRTFLEYSLVDEIHFGCIYRYPPYIRGNDNREVMVAAFARKFEIDLNQFEDRKCCGKEKKICPICWDDLGLRIVSCIEGGYAEWGMTKKPFLFFSGNKSIYVYISCPLYRHLPAFSLLEMIKKKMAESVPQITFDEGVSAFNHALKVPFSYNSKSNQLVRPITQRYRTYEDLNKSLNECMRTKRVCVQTGRIININHVWEEIVKDFQTEINQCINQTITTDQ